MPPHPTWPVATYGYGRDAGVAVRSTSPRNRTRQGVVKCLGVLLVVLFLVGMSWPSVFKHPAGFALFALALIGMAVGSTSDSRSRARTQVLIVSLAFVAFGAIVLVLSAMHVFAIEPTLPVRNDFMLRQAYFLFLWIPLLLGAASFWKTLGSSVIAVCRRWALPILIILAIADVVTARLFGDPTQLAWVHYNSFLDKFG